MNLLNKIKKVINHFDLFYSAQLLRYDSQTQYKTLTGGLLSLSIIIVIIIGFANMISQTLDMSSITSSLTSIKIPDPPLIYLQPGKKNMYALGIAIQSIDFSFTADLYNGPQHFQLKTKMVKIQNGVPTFSFIYLEQCTREHYAMMPEFNKHFDSFAIGKWACLPLNHSYPIQGVYTSSLSYQIEINVFKCRNSTQNNNNCAPQVEIDGLFNTYRNFILSFNYINPIINPNLKDYISYYIEGNDYVLFSSDVGSQAWIYYTDYQITTDQSIWPFSSYTTEQGFVVESKAINHPYGVYDDSSLSSIYLAKSANSLVYYRQVQKISAVFSYVGGLVGAVTAALFFVNIYTDTSLEVTIGINLFEQKQQENENAKNFNFLSFVRLTLYQLLKFVGWGGVWQVPEKLEKYQEEAVKQLDVQILLKRLIKLEVCMACLFSDEQLKEIKEAQPITMENAQRMRSLLLKHQKLRQGRDSKVINADNQIEKNAPKVYQDPYNDSAKSLFHSKAIHDQNIQNTYKIEDIQSLQENRNPSQSPNSQSLFLKLQEIQDRKRESININNLSLTQK